MKKTLFTILLLIPFVGFSQVTDSISAYLDGYETVGKSLIYTQVYELPGKTQTEIKQLLIKTFSNVPKLSIVQASLTDDQFVTDIQNHMVDYRKYGGKWGSTATWIIHPFFGDATFQIKDGKYRVVVKNVRSVSTPYVLFSFNSDFVKKDGTIWGVDTKIGRQGYYYFARSMNELFDVTKYSTQSNW